MAQENHSLPGFNFNVEEWFEGDRYETLAICRSLEMWARTSQRIGRRGTFRSRSRPRREALYHSHAVLGSTPRTTAQSGVTFQDRADSSGATNEALWHRPP
jgi:hypothetical protein